MNKDLIVGIPSYNEEDSISFVVKQIDRGLTRYFPELRTQIINVDNNSPDNTKQAFLNTKTINEKIYISTPPKIKGKGNNFYNLFKYAQETEAKAVIVVDADLKSITPDWIKRLGQPILDGTDFVSPLYTRHKHDGTITNNIVFPLVYSLFNKYIRQPIGGEFAFSKKLIDHYLNQQWNETTKQYGIDIFITMNALIGNFPTKQTFLGTKIHKPSAPKLGQMFTQVVNTLFDLITSNYEIVQRYNGEKKQEPEIIVPEFKISDIEVNMNNLKETSHKCFDENKEFLRRTLNKEIFKKIDYSFNNGIVVDSDLWSDIVFEFLNKYKKNNLELIEALKPLYLATTHTFIEQTKNIPSHQAEELIIKQAEIFWEKKHRFLGIKNN